MLHCTLVRHKLQYASVVWNSITATDGIQRLFLSVCHRRFFHNFEYDYVNALNYLKFHILSFWRRHLEALFRRVRKIAKSDFTFMCVCPSVRTCGTTRPPTGQICIKFDNMSTFRKSVEKMHL
jgi:hypothetical protein